MVVVLERLLIGAISVALIELISACIDFSIQTIPANSVLFWFVIEFLLLVIVLPESLVNFRD